MFVKYVDGVDFYDGLTTGKTYEIADENESQYIVNNDLGGTSSIQKSKFEIIKSEFEVHKQHLFNLVTGLQSFYETGKLTGSDRNAIEMLKSRIDYKIKMLFQLTDDKFQ